ncbi:MAG: hypothetical protein IBX62_05395 [Coriobacteriia bacterium]|nr:hypothetical protein [Coriobacteriia bacterium]
MTESAALSRARRRPWPLRRVAPVAALAGLLALGMAPGCAANEEGASGRADYVDDSEARYGGVWWAGDGAFVVAQLTAADGVPHALAFDMRSRGAPDVQEGKRVVAVEPHSPRVWLVPDEGGGSVEDLSDLAGDLRDSPPRRLLMWDLGAGDDPTDDVESRWRPWPGPGGTTAFLEVDVLKGALPSRLLLQPSDGSTEGTRVALPEAVTTFEPLGWSPSGEWFALASAGSDGPRLLLCSPEGGIIASGGRPAAKGGRGTIAVWLQDADTMFYVAEDGSSGTLGPGEPDDVFTASPGALPLGSVPAGPLVWHLGAVAVPGRERVASAPVAGLAEVLGIAYHPRAGLAVLEGAPLRLTVGPLEDERTRIWEADG